MPHPDQASSAGLAAAGDDGQFMGMDIGGSLTKIAILEPHPSSSLHPPRMLSLLRKDPANRCMIHDETLSVNDKQLQCTVHFLSFESSDIEEIINYVRQNSLYEGIRQIRTAGGGAHKFKNIFLERIGVELVPVDELAVVVRGISWLTKQRTDEVYHVGEKGERCYHEPSSLFPYLLVNVGSGVSIVRVDGPLDFERVSGAALGGGTFWGLAQLLTRCKTFQGATAQAVSGNPSSVNLLVQDIYGGDYKLESGATLQGSLTASYFAKVGSCDESPSDADVLHALITMITQSICQVAYLNAQIQGTSRIVFTGNFLRENQVARTTIRSSMARVNLAQAKGETLQALFLEHEGYFGAIGSLLIQSATLLGRKVEDLHPVARSTRVWKSVPCQHEASTQRRSQSVDLPRRSIYYE